MAEYKLEWDKAGEHLYETGTDHCVLYVYDKEKNGYGAGVAWNGITGITESPEGAEANDFYADNIKYASIRSAETFGGTIEAYSYPDEWMQCDGSADIATGVYAGQQARKVFGMSYRTRIGSDTMSTDEAYKLHLVYGATASPSERAYETINDSPDAIQFSWEFDTTPVAFTGANASLKPTSIITVDSTKADKEKLAQLEVMLYGTKDGEDAKLPTPDEVMDLFKTI